VNLAENQQSNSNGGRIRAVVFDYGGVLAEVNSPADGFAAMSRIIHAVLPETELTLSDIDTDLRYGWKAYAGWKRAQSRSREPVEMSQAAFWEMVTCDWGEAERAAVSGNVVTLTRDLELHVIQPPANPDTAAVLGALRQAGIKVGLASNCLSGDAARVQLAADGLLDLFDIALFSNEVGYRKPGARLLQHAMTALKVDAHESCFVGDRLDRDILAARRAQMGLCVLKIAMTGSGDSLRDVSADAVIDGLGELLPLLGLAGFGETKA
jgi:FMN phosphatase YigB (HAD superfamily)